MVKVHEPEEAEFNIETMSTYIHTKMSVCLFVTAFLWDTLWHNVSFRPRMSSKTIKFQKKLFSAELMPFFYIF